MKTVARLERKENKLDTQPCVIDAIREIPAEEYNAFSKNMLNDYDFIHEHQDMMRVDCDGLTHCMLVMGTDLPDIMGCRSDYPAATPIVYATFRICLRVNVPARIMTSG